MNRIPDNGQPWSMPHLIASVGDWKSSKQICVVQFVTFLRIHSVYSFGMPLLHMLVNSCSSIMLGKATFMSRNSAPTTLFLLHVSFVYEVR